MTLLIGIWWVSWQHGNVFILTHQTLRWHKVFTLLSPILLLHNSNLVFAKPWIILYFARSQRHGLFRFSTSRGCIVTALFIEGKNYLRYTSIENYRRIRWACGFNQSLLGEARSTDTLSVCGSCRICRMCLNVICIQFVFLHNQIWEDSSAFICNSQPHFFLLLLDKILFLEKACDRYRELLLLISMGSCGCA